MLKWFGSLQMMVPGMHGPVGTGAAEEVVVVEDVDVEESTELLELLVMLGAAEEGVELLVLLGAAEEGAELLVLLGAAEEIVVDLTTVERVEGIDGIVKLLEMSRIVVGNGVRV